MSRMKESISLAVRSHSGRLPVRVQHACGSGRDIGGVSWDGFSGLPQTELGAAKTWVAFVKNKITVSPLTGGEQISLIGRFFNAMTGNSRDRISMVSVRRLFFH